MSNQVSDLPTLGLIVRKQWLDMIFEGKKLWEMRCRKTGVRGRIALIEAGSGLIKGETNLVDSLDALTHKDATDYQMLHQVVDMHLLEKWRYPWVLTGTVKYWKPIPYRHPKGAVIWVNLRGSN